MAKKCVFTICIGDKFKELSKLTHPTLKAYADKIGADFVIKDKQTVSKTTPHFEKFAIYDLLNKYDRIVYLDSDLIIRDDCPDLTEIVPESKLGMFNEGGWADRNLAMAYGRDAYKINPIGWDGAYYNSGVMVISRKHKQLFKKPLKEEPIFYEQTYLNLIIARDRIEMHQLKYNFNRMTLMDAPTGESRLASYIVHYAGAPDVNALPGIIEKDLHDWKSAKGNYKYKRNIWVNVQGGLGDQVDAEPAIRFMLREVYPNDNVVVTSHWPRLFNHLKDATVMAHEDFMRTGDVPFFHMCTLPGPETPMWLYVSNLMCHTVDFCSMAMLRRTLPDTEKNIKLDVLPEDIKEVEEVIDFPLEKLIVIHPGRHWESKTFPKDWWQTVIDGIQKIAATNGMKVALIGKNDDTRGTVDVECPEGAYDTRDLLSLGGLLAIISKANLTISNDSAPIHIAGAFDNKIILIPTCKHPDHILPYRNGLKTYKSKALYRELTLSKIPTAPTTVHGSTADYVVGNILDFLPCPETVIEEVFSKWEV